MNRWMMAGAVGVGAAALVLGTSAEPVSAQAKAPPGWLNDLAAAKTAARQSGKPIFLVFR
ncbi:hypothetical protein AYO44_18670 [Planctomycetaceae bacterium SCGC AG-212-F19]|nr:hypothetical protein AYO44_18670 [Planctomycetaceae bacterium SCGC AG-212-F19]